MHSSRTRREPRTHSGGSSTDPVTSKVVLLYPDREGLAPVPMSRPDHYQ